MTTDSPWSIALDSIHAMMYWTLKPRSGAGKLQRARLDGTAIEDLATLDPLPVLPEVAVNPFGAKVYWTDSYVIRRANLDGSGVENLIPTNAQYGAPIAVDLVPPIPTLSGYGLMLMFAALIAGGVVLTRQRILLQHAHPPCEEIIPCPQEFI